MYFKTFYSCCSAVGISSSIESEVMYQYKNAPNSDVSVYQIVGIVIEDEDDICQDQSYVPRCAVVPGISIEMLELDMENNGCSISRNAGPWYEQTATCDQSFFVSSDTAGELLKILDSEKRNEMKFSMDICYTGSR